MAKCLLCNSESYLIYAPGGIVTITPAILCERCYARYVFTKEYPNLSTQSVAHIKQLPHLTTNTQTQNTSQLPIFNFGQSLNGPMLGNASPFTSAIQPTMGMNTPIFKPQNHFGAQHHMTPELNAKLQNFLSKDDDATQKKQPFSNFGLQSNSSTAFNSSTVQQHPQVPNGFGTSSTSSPTRADIAKGLNDFIKKTLFPDMMDLPNSEPPAKSSKLQTSSSDTAHTELEDRTDWPFEWIGGDVNNIRDLIRIGREYKTNPKRVQTNLDMQKLSQLVEPLETLQNMVGLEDIKNSIFKQVVFHLQDLDNGNKDMHHTVIKGPPGVGKTQISHIIARIYKGLGFLKKDTVVSVKRDDLIAGYLGQTAMKAKKKYEEALGGVLLIDEAYALGDGSDKDSYSKEAIDLLTSYLSEHGHEFICIIAGYKEALEKRFFSVNEGLARRFNIHYDIKPYSGSDICQIFQKLVTDGGWQLDASAYSPEFFTENLDSFPHFGGDMLNLFAYTKKAHSSRLLAIRTKEQLMNTKKKINMADLEAGFEQYKVGNGYATKDASPFEAKFMYM